MNLIDGTLQFLGKIALYLRLNFGELNQEYCGNNQLVSTYVEQPWRDPRSGSVLQDIAHVLSELTPKDILNFLKAVVFNDLFDKTIKGKFIGLFSAFKTLFKGAFRFLRNPILSLIKTKDWLSNIFTQLNSAWATMTPAQKRSSIIRLVAYIISAAIGAYIGIQIPDMDISLWGIGSHRNFFTHSVAPALVIEFTYRVIRRLIHGFKDRLPENRKTYWENSINVADDCLQSFVIGSYAGITLHLGKDLFFDGSQSIRGPWGNTFIKNTYLDDNLYLGIHTALAAPDLMTFRESLND